MEVIQRVKARVSRRENRHGKRSWRTEKRPTKKPGRGYLVSVSRRAMKTTATTTAKMERGRCRRVRGIRKIMGQIWWTRVILHFLSRMMPLPPLVPLLRPVVERKTVCLRSLHQPPLLRIARVLPHQSRAEIKNRHHHHHHKRAQMKLKLQDNLHAHPLPHHSPWLPLGVLPRQCIAIDSKRRPIPTSSGGVISVQRMCLRHMWPILMVAAPLLEHTTIQSWVNLPHHK